MRNIVFALALALVCMASNAYAVDHTLINNTSWSVGALGDAAMTKDAPHPTPWVFQADGSVRAQGYWVGAWVSYPDQNKLKVTIVTTSGLTDTFEVDFLTSNWFVATKNNQLYRYGKRL
ncbi:hypothetical protein [Cystobacter fuscus]|uniref:hypothetical protein n=1 Tax=Cystobacter fuscus TaxID=43 RepID=UPI0012DF015B|nr:hypothetical protein [Cystobacter fuscus]